MLIDSHCHLNFEPLGNELDAVLREATEAGISHLLCITVTLEDFKEILQISRNYAHVFASLGVHPNEQDGREAELEELVSLGEAPQVVAIGETGLDYFRSEGDLAWQRRRFVCHIEASLALEKPLIIHTRAAMEDTLAILRQYAGRCTGVMHCFSGTWEEARRALDLGFYLSFSGMVTFRNATALREVAAKAPDDRILIETDAPFLAPVPHRGKVNRPAYLRHTAEAMAEVRGTSMVELAALTSGNFFNLFPAARALVENAAE